jgi:hypothetical protein
MSDEAVIYVELTGEGVEVWRPVVATPQEAGVYHLSDEQPDDETWVFPPGSRVRCEARLLEGDRQLVACALAD